MNAIVDNICFFMHIFMWHTAYCCWHICFLSFCLSGSAREWCWHRSLELRPRGIPDGRLWSGQNVVKGVGLWQAYLEGGMATRWGGTLRLLVAQAFHQTVWQAHLSRGYQSAGSPGERSCRVCCSTILHMGWVWSIWYLQARDDEPSGQYQTRRYSCDFESCWSDVQWNPSGKARNVSLKLQKLVVFHVPFFRNHVCFTPHDRPPLLKGHHLKWPL